MKSTAILSHTEVTNVTGHLDYWLEKNNFSIKRYYRENDYDPDEVNKATLVIILGSPNSVAEGFCSYPYEKEIVLIKERLEQNRPLLAICYGAQALALALGGKVIRMKNPIIGYQKLLFHRPPLEQGPWPIWHEDGITIDGLKGRSGVEILGANGEIVEAYRYRSSWGIQFHPELHSKALTSSAESVNAAQTIWSGMRDSIAADEEQLKARSISLFDTFWSDVSK